MKRIKFVGLDVHAETIAVAVAEHGRGGENARVIPNREESIRKLVKKLGPVEQLCFCYEAGPTGYVVYWQLTALGAKCEVVAPTLVPVKSGERVKTDVSMSSAPPARQCEQFAGSRSVSAATVIRTYVVYFLN